MAEGPPTKRPKRQKNVLIGVTGSVASIKLSKLVDELLLLEPKVLCKLTKANGDLSSGVLVHNNLWLERSRPWNEVDHGTK